MTTSAPKTKTILVLCTGNSARSIMAEAYLNQIGLNQIGKSQWRAVSAGSKPTGRVNPFALLALAEAGIPVPENPRSKSWNEFAGAQAQPIDLVLTVCDNAAGEACPHFPGPARKVHIGFPDPAAVEGTDQQKLAAFLAVLDQMRPKLTALLQDQ